MITFIDKKGKVEKIESPPNLTTITVGGLFVDRLSVVIPAPYVSDQKYLLKALEYLKESGHSKQRYSHSYKNVYQIWADSTDTTDHPIHVSAAPRNPDQKFLRLEYNPSRITTSEARSYIDFILPGGYQQMVDTGTVTRIDLAVDINGGKPDDFIIFASKIRRTSAYYKNGTESYYLGDKSSSHYVIYDKTAEIKKRNQKKTIPDPVPDHPVTRIERRCKNRVYFTQLHEIENQFTRLTLSSMLTVPVTGEIDRLFMDSVRYRGATDALKLCSPSTRLRIRESLKKAQCDFWKPEDIWMTWPKLAEDLISPGPATFYL
jgi:hypothetical protein